MADWLRPAEARAGNKRNRIVTRQLSSLPASQPARPSTSQSVGGCIKKVQTAAAAAAVAEKKKILLVYRKEEKTKTNKKTK